MSPNNTHTTKASPPPVAGTAASDGFHLDVALVEVADVAGLISLTDDNCGETCGACTTNVA
ncbi:FxLD family lanthipeptide [Streptomyces antimycoticus]|uniref:FxLD family lanthipeptide n=1 Tax=Streptomyces antimycoticus TaxID=68175 RepID=UPI00367DD375